MRGWVRKGRGPHTKGAAPEKSRGRGRAGAAGGRGRAGREGRGQWLLGRGVESGGRHVWGPPPGGRALRGRTVSPHLLQPPFVRVPLLCCHRLAAAQQPHQIQLQPRRCHRHPAVPCPFRWCHLEGGRKCLYGASFRTDGLRCSIFACGGSNAVFQGEAPSGSYLFRTGSRLSLASFQPHGMFKRTGSFGVGAAWNESFPSSFPQPQNFFRRPPLPRFSPSERFRVQEAFPGFCWRRAPCPGT